MFIWNKNIFVLINNIIVWNNNIFVLIYNIIVWNNNIDVLNTYHCMSLSNNILR